MRSIWKHHGGRPDGQRSWAVYAFAIGLTRCTQQRAPRRAIDSIATCVGSRDCDRRSTTLWAWLGLPAGYTARSGFSRSPSSPVHARYLKSVSTSLAPDHRELEEAAWVCGKGRIGTIRTIVMPLARPGTVVAMTLMLSWRVASSAPHFFLYTSDRW